MTTSATTVTAAGTSTGTRLSALLDRKLADAKQPLFEILGWYNKAYTTARCLNEEDRSANETAALRLGIEFNSEAEIGTQPCGCTRPDPDVCECYATLQAARAALARVPEPILDPDPDHAPTKEEVEQELADRAREVLRSRSAEVIPHEIDLWSAMLFLAPLGHELAQEALALALRARPAYDETPVNETVFQGRRYITLLYAAFDAHPHNADCDPAPIIQRWQELGIAAVESAYLVDWFCANHPSRAHQIERDLKIKLGKQGWHV
jgi:hypothetical protein